MAGAKMCQKCRRRRPRSEFDPSTAPFCAGCLAATRMCSRCGPRPVVCFTSRCSGRFGDRCDACYLEQAERPFASFAERYGALLTEGPAADRASSAFASAS